MLYRLQNNTELLEGLNESIISNATQLNEKKFISGYFTHIGEDEKAWLNVILRPYQLYDTQSEWESYKPLLDKLLYLILRSKFESGQSVDPGNINRELSEES